MNRALGHASTIRDGAARTPGRPQTHNDSLPPADLNSLLTAGAHLELSYSALAPHASERMASALALAKHAKATERHVKCLAISASALALKALAEAGGGFVTFSLLN